jgi:hypothetical protein
MKWDSVILIGVGTGGYSVGPLLRLPNNLTSCPKWQQWLRDAKLLLPVLWGRSDTS